jgi:hypothetical protein
MRKRTLWLILFCLAALLAIAVYGGGGWMWGKLLEMHGIRAHAAPAGAAGELGR